MRSATPLLLLCVSLLVPSARADRPDALWVAPGATLSQAREVGLPVRDRFPDALVLDDGAAAAALAAAGAAVEGPLAVRAEAQVILLHAHGAHSVERAQVDEIAALPDVDVLWSGTRSLLIQSASRLPAAGPLRHLDRQALSPARLRVPARAADAPALRATAFDPLVDDIVAAVDSAAYFRWIERLAGATPVTVGGSPVTFTTRWSYSPQCNDAEQYVHEQFSAMGHSQVAYDPYNIQAWPARNVIAEIPGTQTPDEIVILCGHLDSTSPVPSTSAPGGNDNASGTAAVLTGAEILRNYVFASTVRFVAFTGEEQGLFGSKHYAAAAAAAEENIVGVVNCDMISWWGSTYRLDIEGEAFADPLMQVMNDACQAYTGLSTQLLYNAWGSDHVPFLNNGFPAFLAIESDYASYPCYHQSCDTAALNEAGFGVEVTRACLATVAHLAGVLGTTSAGPLADAGLRRLQVWPNPFRTRAQVRFSLDRPGEGNLVVHDVAGRRVRTLLRGALDAGRGRAEWDGRDDRGRRVPPGVYFVRLRTAGLQAVQKAVRLR